MRLNIQGWLKQQIAILFSLKAETSLNNLTATGKENIEFWTMPKYSAGIARVINSTYVADKNCLVVVRSANGATPFNILVENQIVGCGGNAYANSRTFGYAFVAKGQTYQTTGIASYGSWDATVIEFPLVGG